MAPMIELPALTLTPLPDGIVHAHFKDGRVGTREDVASMFTELRRIADGHKLLLLVSLGAGASLTNEARAFASGTESNEIIAADAIIVRDFGHQMAANAFVRHNRPARPAQLFPDKASALEWLAQQHHLLLEQ